MLPPTITNAFALPGRVDRTQRFGNGLINDTYLVSTHDESGGNTEKFIFQRINHHVFKDPASLMGNVERVCGHMRRKLGVPGNGNHGNAAQRALTLVPTRTDAFLHRTTADTAGDAGDSFWRCFHFIDGCTSHDVIDSPELAYQAALQFGKFQCLMADLNGDRLNETIPDFHHTPKRLAALKAAVQADPLGRAVGCRKEIRFALDQEPMANHLLKLNACGLIPERVTHNDTKISNVLICNKSRRGVCVVDLDTVMPGLSLYDFGDLVRTTVSPVSEESTELDSIEVRMPVFEALAAGFLEAMADVLTPAEHENLAFSGMLLTYEVAIRFLTDHLLGDPYFGAKYPDHNLHRAQNQIQLVRILQANQAHMSRHQLTA